MRSYVKSNLCAPSTLQREGAPFTESFQRRAPQRGKFCQLEEFSEEEPLKGKFQQTAPLTEILLRCAPLIGKLQQGAPFTEIV